MYLAWIAAAIVILVFAQAFDPYKLVSSTTQFWAGILMVAFLSATVLGTAYTYAWFTLTFLNIAIVVVVSAVVLAVITMLMFRNRVSR